MICLNISRQDLPVYFVLIEYPWCERNLWSKFYCIIGHSEMNVRATCHGVIYEILPLINLMFAFLFRNIYLCGFPCMPYILWGQNITLQNKIAYLNWFWSLLYDTSSYYFTPYQTQLQIKQKNICWILKWLNKVNKIELLRPNHFWTTCSTSKFGLLFK